MKKIINLKRICLLFLLFVLGATPICYADLYVSPTEKLIAAVPFLGIALIILAVIFIVNLVCMAVGKTNKSEELVSKTKKDTESIFYYLLLLLGLAFAVTVFSSMPIIGIVPLAVVFVSLYLRLKKENKKSSYIVLGIYLGIMLALFISSIIG